MLFVHRIRQPVCRSCHNNITHAFEISGVHDLMQNIIQFAVLCKYFNRAKVPAPVAIRDRNTAFDIRIWEYLACIRFIVQNLKMRII